MILILKHTKKDLLGRPQKPKKTLRKSASHNRKKTQQPTPAGDPLPYLPPLERHIGYARTKDILQVMNILGHKGIQNTLKYMQLVNVQSDEYVSKAPREAKEASQLIEGGFKYVFCHFRWSDALRKRK